MVDTNGKETNNTANSKSSGVDRSKSILSVAPENLTPGMKQYYDIKKANPDCIVMLRMGDFYELFYEDAVTAARELEITLTSRGQGEKKAPLAGVPHHALEPYLGKLVKKGYKVAIVEQLEDPKKAKGLVKRGLVRIVTPGTIIESSMLNENENNYIMALSSFGEEFALAICDLSTGEFSTMLLSNFSNLQSELARYKPSEIIVPESLKVNSDLMKRMEEYFLNCTEDYDFTTIKSKELLLSHFNLQSLDPFGLQNADKNISVCGALLQYLINTQKNTLSHIKKISIHSTQTMLLDASTLKNLELSRSLRENSVKGSLLSVLDKTTTSMGSRMLKRWLTSPLLDKRIIEKRHSAIQELNDKVIAREELISLLERVYDIERLISRVNYGNATPRDLLALRDSLRTIPLIKNKMQLFAGLLLKDIGNIPGLEELATLIGTSIKEDASVTIREGNLIKEGFCTELDGLHSISTNSKKYLQELEAQEKQKTGISALKLGYTRVFGYYIEVTKRNLHLVPPHYIRKQTTVNSERYITEELKVEEEKILGAQEKIAEMEYNLFQEICSKVALRTSEVQLVAGRLAVLDVLCSFSKTAMENNYCRPAFVDENVIQIRKGRHPVVEKIESSYIANDVVLSNGEMMIITGPNMSGKSTLMRQVALIVLMAQIGSFVPAQEAVLGITDRIFTRVGAQDDLSSGQSTFMVEMNETSAILNSATEKSLIIMDEIGRGTSTFDGVSIAWSVAEHIYNRIKAKTLFSTHYHVMNKLAEKFSKIKNYNLAAREVNGEVVFLHQLIEGGTDQSYGIHVAELAGMPAEVVARAREIQEILEKDDDMVRRVKAKKLEEQKGLGEF